MIERADIHSVLLQMRAMQADAQQGIKAVNFPTSPVEVAQVGTTQGFDNLLKNAIDRVNETQTQASRLATAYETGDPRVELSQVMIQLQKSSVSFQALTQVRNRLVTAYEDVMKMPI